MSSKSKIIKFVVMTIHEATYFLLKKLRSIYAESEASQITDWVMENITGSGKTERMLYKNSAITDKEEVQLNQYADKLMMNEPVQYVLGEAWFAGMKFHVDKNVLIPRPETEEMLDWVIADCRLQIVDLDILDIGTGSGCIAVSLKKKLPRSHIKAVDVCSEALFVATNNAINLDAEVDFVLLDFLDKNKWNELGLFDIIISNPPYVKQDEITTMHQRVTNHEPHLALFVPDNDALLFYKAIAGFGKTHLQPGGAIYVEINEALGKEVTELFKKEGYTSIEIKKDMQGKERMVKVKR